MSTPEAAAFQKMLRDLLLFLLPYYVAEGKSHLVVAIGCTGEAPFGSSGEKYRENNSRAWVPGFRKTQGYFRR